MGVRTTLSGTPVILVSLVTLVTPEMVETALVRDNILYVATTVSRLSAVVQLIRINLNFV